MVMVKMVKIDSWNSIFAYNNINIIIFILLYINFVFSISILTILTLTILTAQLNFSYFISQAFENRNGKVVPLHRQFERNGVSLIARRPIAERERPKLLNRRYEVRGTRYEDSTDYETNY